MAEILSTGIISTIFSNQLRRDTPFTVQVRGIRDPTDDLQGYRWCIYDGVEKNAFVFYLGQSMASIERYTVVKG